MFAGVGFPALIPRLASRPDLREISAPGCRSPGSASASGLSASRLSRGPCCHDALGDRRLYGYTDIASLLYAAAGIEGPYLSAVLFVWGLSAAAGVFGGGTLTDKLGAQPVIVLGLFFLALAFAVSHQRDASVQGRSRSGLALVAIVVWGPSAWHFLPAQQTRLIGIAGIKVAPIVLSLNASFMFLGFPLGAALGSLTLTYAAPSALGWVGGLCVLASLLLSIRTMRATAAAPEPILQQ